MSAPSDGEVLQLVREIKAAKPEMGIKKVHAEVKSLRTDWLVGEKRVKKAMAALNDGCGASAPAGGAVASASAATDEDAATAPPSLETCAGAPSPRLYFSLASDTAGGAARDQLVLFGGELTTGKGRSMRTKFFTDTFVFDVGEKHWLRATGSGPSARSGHHSCIVGRTMYTFGGEFCNAKGTTFQHHDDLWAYDLDRNAWANKAVKTSGDCPSGRSGARMVGIDESTLLLFGGFSDTGKTGKYYNDMYAFDVPSSTWTRIGFADDSAVPPKRSAFQWALESSPATGSDGGSTVILFGGYCTLAKPKKKTNGPPKVASAAQGDPTAEDEFEQLGTGVTYTDAWRLTCRNGGGGGSKQYEWARLKTTGDAPGARGGFGMSIWERKMLVFGGVSDVDRGDRLESTFYNDVFSLDLDSGEWQPLLLGETFQPEQLESSSDESEEEEDVGDEDEEQAVGAGQAPELEPEPEQGAAGDAATARASRLQQLSASAPGARSGAGVAVVGDALWVYGGKNETAQGAEHAWAEGMWCLGLQREASRDLSGTDLGGASRRWMAH